MRKQLFSPDQKSRLLSIPQEIGNGSFGSKAAIKRMPG
jgi:hypothetical protein